MEQTGSDFTNTFRAFSEIKNKGDNEACIQTLVALAAPRDFFIKKVKHEHADNPKMARILAEQPDMLKFYGMDPDVVRAEIEESKLKMKEINDTFDSKFKPKFAELWRNLVTEYQSKLGGSQDD